MFYRSLEASAALSTPPQRRRTGKRRSTLRKISAHTAPKQLLPDLVKLNGGYPSGSGSQISLAASDGELECRDDELLGKGGLDLTGNIPHQQNVGRVSSWAVNFERLLQDQLGLECFTLFLKKEFSQENIMFWIACEQMGKMKDRAMLEKHAQDIYDKFLSPKATMAVNLEGQCRELVEAAIKNPTPEMFKTQQQQIFKLMKFDSYSRFLKSKMYQDCVLAEMGGEQLPFLSKSSPKTTKPQDTARLAVAEEKAQKKKSWLPFRKF